MPARFNFFNKRNNAAACNPYREFWEFLEWLARRRQYPEPMYIWRGMQTPMPPKPFGKPFVKPPKGMKFPGKGGNEFNKFPAADESRETVNISRRKM